MKKYVALGSDDPRYIKCLKNRGYEVISVPRFSLLSEPVSRHCDMLFARVGDIIISNGGYSLDAVELFCYFISAGYRFRYDYSTDFSSYPSEAKFNILYHNGCIYANKKCLSNVISDLAAELSIPVIHVNQGYAACSCAVCGNGVITSDISLMNALEKNGVPCLLISSGHINIDGYEYGFIGGASGYSRFDNTLYFTGNLRSHPDYVRIFEFADNMGVALRSLCSGPLFDVGGLVFF